MDRQKWTLMGSAGLGAGLGAGLMYLLDPQNGARRLALARDKAAHALRKGGRAALRTTKDLGNRTRGLVAEAGSRLRPGELDDQVLRDRVRSKVGRLVSKSSAIEVAAKQGCVILTGSVLAAELDRLLSVVGSLKGVKEVKHRLKLHERGTGLQATTGNGRTVPRFLRRNWAGATLGAVSLGLLARSLKGPEAARTA